MNIQQKIQLASLTTFKIGGVADYFVEVTSLEELARALDFASAQNLQVFVLGGGSNILVSDAGIRGLVIKVSIRGIAVVEESDESVVLQIGAGEWWDGVVAYAVEKGWWGIENLSHIPGLAGGLAVQNVGAYGQETSQVLAQVTALDYRGVLGSEKNPETKDSPVVVRFTNEDCHFGYRSSIFNAAEKGRYIITSITLKLSKIANPNVRYPDLQKRFEGQHDIDIHDIRQAIIEIRNTKFPYPDKPERGNAGSFFKNVELTQDEYANLETKIRQNFDEAIVQKLVDIKNKFPTQSGLIKIPTAFLIDICGLKDFSNGLVTVNPPQPMILVNSSGTATASDVLDVFRHVRTVVYEKTGVQLQNEPELVGFSEAELAAIYAL